jgi:hypothetical protein
MMAESHSPGREAALERGEDPKEVNKEFDVLEEAYNQSGKEEYWKRKA